MYINAIPSFLPAEMRQPPSFENIKRQVRGPGKKLKNVMRVLAGSYIPPVREKVAVAIKHVASEIAFPLSEQASASFFFLLLLLLKRLTDIS